MLHCERRFTLSIPFGACAVVRRIYHINAFLWIFVKLMLPSSILSHRLNITFFLQSVGRYTSQFIFTNVYTSKSIYICRLVTVYELRVSIYNIDQPPQYQNYFEKEQITTHELACGRRGRQSAHNYNFNSWHIQFNGTCDGTILIPYTYKLSHKVTSSFPNSEKLKTHSLASRTTYSTQKIHNSKLKGS